MLVYEIFDFALKARHRCAARNQRYALRELSVRREVLDVTLRESYQNHHLSDPYQPRCLNVRDSAIFSFSLYVSPKFLIVLNGFHRTALESGGYQNSFLKFFVLKKIKFMKFIGRYATGRTGLLSFYFLKYRKNKRPVESRFPH